MPDGVVAAVEAMAANEQQPIVGHGAPFFEWAPGVPIEDEPEGQIVDDADDDNNDPANEAIGAEADNDEAQGADEDNDNVGTFPMATRSQSTSTTIMRVTKGHSKREKTLNSTTMTTITMRSFTRPT